MSKIIKIELDLIDPSALNPRKTYDPEKMKDLVASIKEIGVTQAVMVRPKGERYETVYGHRRVLASKEAGLNQIPCDVRPLNDDEALLYASIENLQREDVHPLEEAEGYEEIMKRQSRLNVDDLAIKVGKSKAYIYGRVKLLDLIPKNRERFRAGRFSASVALMVARVPAHLQEQAGKRIARDIPGVTSEPMSHMESQIYLSTELMLQLKSAPFDTDNALLIKDAGSCSFCVKRTGNQAELFPDITNIDTCTDPECYARKKIAHVEKTIARAREAGSKVLSMREAKQVFPTASAVPARDYVSLEMRCEQDPRRRTYKQLLKDAKLTKVSTVVAVNPNSSEAVTMISTSMAAAVRKSAGIKPPASSSSRKQDPAAAQREKDKEAKEKASFEAILKHLVVKLNHDQAHSFLRPLINLISDLLGNSVELDPIDKTPDNQLPGVIFEMLMRDQHDNSLQNETMTVLCNHYGVNVKQVLADGEPKHERQSHQAPDPATPTKPSEPAAPPLPEAPAENSPELQPGDANYGVGMDWKCLKCGCTDAAACSGGCHWAAPNLCSRCAPEQSESNDAQASVRARRAQVKTSKDGKIETKTAKGRKVVITSKEQLSEDDQREIGAALGEVADLLGGGK